jgi:hypothetical protein
MSEKNMEKNTVDQAVELEDNQLDGIAGGGAAGGPICPVCGSTNVDIDVQRRVILKCHKCGYQAK